MAGSCVPARARACVRVCLPVCASLRCSEVSKPRAEVQLSFAAGQRDKNIQETRTASKMWVDYGEGSAEVRSELSWGKRIAREKGKQRG